jgi:hypothetical protein
MSFAHLRLERVLSKLAASLNVSRTGVISSNIDRSAVASGTKDAATDNGYQHNLH